jgi:predicted nucleotidyltransferase
MRQGEVKAILQGLNEAGVRYLIAGGLAVVAHGYVRFTADVDLVVGLDQENLLRALRVLTDLGYRPRVPVRAESFADAATRESWIRDKGMVVFSMINPQAPRTNVDLFVRIPFDFESELQNAAWWDVAEGVKVPVVSLERLIAMKSETGRSKDRIDFEYLQKIKELRDGERERS